MRIRVNEDFMLTLKHFIIFIGIFLASVSYAGTANDQLISNLLGSWTTHTEGLLVSSDIEITFLDDGTFERRAVMDWGWPQGKKPDSNYGAYEILPESRIRLQPNNGRETVYTFRMPSRNVLVLEDDGGSLTWRRSR